MNSWIAWIASSLVCHNVSISESMFGMSIDVMCHLQLPSTSAPKYWTKNCNALIVTGCFLNVFTWCLFLVSTTNAPRLFQRGAVGGLFCLYCEILAHGSPIAMQTIYCFFWVYRSSPKFAPFFIFYLCGYSASFRISNIYHFAIHIVTSVFVAFLIKFFKSCHCGVCLVVGSFQHFKDNKKTIQSTKREKLF